MNKEREIDGIKVVVSNETYNEYKGTLQDQINELQDRIDFLIYRNAKYIEVLGKIKEYCNNRLDYYQEMRTDYMKEFDGYAENDNENILELLEEIE